MVDSVRQYERPAAQLFKHKSTIGKLFVVVLTMFATSDCYGQSLWHAREPERVSLVSDTAARRVGDLVTVLVNEDTNVANNDSRRLDKDSDGGFSFDFSSSTSTPANLELSGKSNRNFSGQSQYSVAQEFTDRITVEVLDVLPNGNLVIGGQRERNVGGERRTLIISGTIRSIDLSPNNTISSQHVSNFNVRYDGNGPETSFSNQGWAARVLTRIWPF